MKQFVLKKSANEFDEESKKYNEMNDKLNELYEKLQGDVSEEEGDAIIEEFQNLIKNCGAACFKACTQAFSKELERQVNMNKVDHQIH